MSHNVTLEPTNIFIVLFSFFLWRNLIHKSFISILSFLPDSVCVVSGFDSALISLCFFNSLAESFYKISALFCNNTPPTTSNTRCWLEKKVYRCREQRNYSLPSANALEYLKRAQLKMFCQVLQSFQIVMKNATYVTTVWKQVVNTMALCQTFSWTSQTCKFMQKCCICTC